MTRALTNDELAARAGERAAKAPPDSRDCRAWRQVATALAATKTQDSARTLLQTLTIPTLRDDARKLLNKLIAQELETAEREEES